MDEETEDYSPRQKEIISKNYHHLKSVDYFIEEFPRSVMNLGIPLFVVIEVVSPLDKMPLRIASLFLEGFVIPGVYTFFQQKLIVKRQEKKYSFILDSKITTLNREEKEDITRICLNDNLKRKEGINDDYKTKRML